MKLKKKIKGYFNLLTLDDLPVFSRDSIKLRDKSSILIIDDEPIPYVEPLRKMGFKIDVNKQWQSVKDVDLYNIVISDNKGVTNVLGGNFDGITMLEQARKIYPEKTFALYSANYIDIRNRSLSGFKILKKGDGIDSWIEILDDAVQKFHDPKEYWKLIQTILQEQKLTESEIRKYQSKFVYSLITGKKKISESNSKLTAETLSIILRIASLALNTIKILPTL